VVWPSVPARRAAIKVSLTKNNLPFAAEVHAK